MAKMEEDDLEIMDVVPQSVLRDYFRLQNRYEFIKQSVRASLEKGATVEKGDCTAKLVTSTRRSPSWKKVVEERFGKEVVDEIIAETEPSEVTSLKIDIKKQALMRKEELT